MNKYFFNPVLFIRFSGISFLKKISTLFLFAILFFSVNSSSAQWINQGNPTNFFLYDVSFIDGNTGWICGDSVLKTTNGGTNWITYRNPDGDNFLNCISFINANTGFLGGTNFFKTTNGGVNWQIIGKFFGSMQQISFINSSTGWAACHQSDLLKTTDGGNNWTNTYSGVFSNFESVNFINTNTGWACGWNGRIVKTTNAGANWIDQTSGTANHLRSISFSNANIGRAVGYNSTYLTTTNGGTNWVAGTGPYSGNYYNLYFINESTGWHLGDDGVRLTTNNGTSWINITPTSDATYGISYVAPSTLYIASFNIYKSTTGGFNLTAPSNLTATAVSSSQINLSWTDNSSDEDKFIIERHISGNWTPVDSVNAGVTSYQSTGLVPNTEYMYRVCAKRLNWNGAYSNEVAKRTLIETPINEEPANNEVVYSDTVIFEWVTSEIIMTCTLQVATDSLFSNIVYTLNEVGFNIGSDTLLPGILQNSTKYFWRVRLGNFNNTSNYSTATSFIYQNANYGNNIQAGSNLYYFANSTAGANLSPSKPIYNWRDTTGSVNMILNRIAQMPLGAGSADDGRFDILNQLPVGNSIRLFGVNYTNFYVGTNGIVCFGPFTPNGSTQYEPTSALPQAFITTAIFPLWKDLNFVDLNHPTNRLCYKITADEVIITYLRAPNYVQGGADANDYVSFQVIMKHSASPSTNSKIEVMYNYDQTGSTFISKYNDNTLKPYIIGIEGANNSSQIFQYRYLNGTQQLISQGPMFGSNLALAMGPDVNALPVELASFTSSVNMDNVQLNWSTAMEENNSGFDVERISMVNGQASVWSKVGSVQGSGTTNEAKNYSYEDRNVQSGNYKYRLKQIDYNGNFEYHELTGEVIVGVPTKFALSQNYPNPFNPVTKINFEIPNNSKIVLQVYDVTGRMISELVNKQMEAGYYTVDFNGVNFASGVYFYRITANDFVETKKMLLVK